MHSGQRNNLYLLCHTLSRRSKFLCRVRAQRDHVQFPDFCTANHNMYHNLKLTMLKLFLRYSLVSFNKNMGFHFAISCDIDHALKSTVTEPLHHFSTSKRATLSWIRSISSFVTCICRTSLELQLSGFVWSNNDVANGMFLSWNGFASFEIMPTSHPCRAFFVSFSKLN